MRHRLLRAVDEEAHAVEEAETLGAVGSVGRGQGSYRKLALAAQSQHLPRGDQADQRGDAGEVVTHDLRTPRIPELRTSTFDRGWLPLSSTSVFPLGFLSFC